MGDTAGRPAVKQNKQERTKNLFFEKGFRFVRVNTGAAAGYGAINGE